MLPQFAMAAAAAFGLVTAWWTLADQNRIEQDRMQTDRYAQAFAYDILRAGGAAMNWSFEPGNRQRYGEVPASELRLTQAPGETYRSDAQWRVFYGPVALADGRSGHVATSVCMDACEEALRRAGVAPAEVLTVMMNTSRGYAGVGWTSGSRIDNVRAMQAEVPLPAEAQAAIGGRRLVAVAQMRLDPASDGTPYEAIQGGRTDVCSLVPTGVCPDPGNICHHYLQGSNSDAQGSAVCPQPDASCPAGYSGNGKVWWRFAIWSDSSAARGVLQWSYSPTWKLHSEDCWRDQVENASGACPAGMVGAVGLQRTVRVWTTGQSQVQADWQEVSNSCAAPSCPAGSSGTPPICCAAPTSYDATTNSCVAPPPPTPQSCPAGTSGVHPVCCTAPQSYDTGTNSCVVTPPTPQTCPAGTNGVYPVCCTAPQTYSAATNSCVPPTPPPQACPAGTNGVYPVCCTAPHTYSAATNSCVPLTPPPPPPPACPVGTNGVYPVCCTPPQMYNPGTNRCSGGEVPPLPPEVCPNGTSGNYPVCCTSPQTYNSGTNSCVGSPPPNEANSCQGNLTGVAGTPFYDLSDKQFFAKQTGGGGGANGYWRYTVFQCNSGSVGRAGTFTVDALRHLGRENSHPIGSRLSPWDPGEMRGCADPPTPHGGKAWIHGSIVNIYTSSGLVSPAKPSIDGEGLMVIAMCWNGLWEAYLGD